MAGTVEKIEANEEITALSKHIEQYLDILTVFTQNNSEEVFIFSSLALNISETKENPYDSIM